MKNKKILASCLLSLMVFSCTSVNAAVPIQDANSSRVNLDRQTTETSQNNTVNKTAAKDKADSEKQKLDIRERIQQILNSEEFAAPAQKDNIKADDNMIMGGAVATQEQCVRYLLKHNPSPKLNVSPQELVSYYYEEGSRTGIRPDIAFAQALKETGYFRYGGTVVPAQNNYCGLGTTSATVQGAYFATPRLGVKAHMQHLLAYASTEKPQDKIVDPRYELVRNSYGSNTLKEWKDLNGRWAVPGVGYGQSILEDYYKGILDS